MTFKNTLNSRILAELLSISVMLAVLPALTYAAAKGLLFASYFELGMYRTAFYYFESTLTEHLILLTFCLALSALFVVHLALRKYTYHAFAALLALLLLLTGFRLNRSAWYPAFDSVRGLLCNVLLILAFIVPGFIICKQFPRLNARLGFIIGGLLLLATSGCFYHFRSQTPVMFMDSGEKTGLREANNSLGVAWGDYDHDGWPDVYVSNHLPETVESFLYHNNKGTFSAPRPMARGDMHGVAWADFDNDGDEDLFVAGGNNTPKGPAFANILFDNRNGNFTNIAARAGVEDTLGRAWGAAWADFNNDGLLDLFVVNYFSSSSLFLNGGNGTFKNVAQDAGITATGPGEVNQAGTLCASWADYDGDDDLDLFTAGIQSGIALYRNNGNGTFAEVSKESGLVTAHYLGTEADPRGPSSCAWGDYDNDGDLDLYVAARTGPSGKNLLFQNQGNRTFIEKGAAAGVDLSANSQAALWADFDNDGDLDLYVVNGASEARNSTGGNAWAWNSLFLNRGDGTFVDFPADKAGVAGYPFVREPTGALVDYDNDGFIDIYINNQRVLRGHPWYLLRNVLLRNAGNGNHWLKIRLQGTVSNRDGIGAKLTLSAGDQRQFREQGGGANTFSQSSTIVHFGLGAARTVDRLLIRWPSGIQQTLTHLSANRTLTITEPHDLPSTRSSGHRPVRAVRVAANDSGRQGDHRALAGSDARSSIHADGRR
jgi:hypothetical protein